LRLPVGHDAGVPRADQVVGDAVELLRGKRRIEAGGRGLRDDPGERGQMRAARGRGEGAQHLCVGRRIRRRIAGERRRQRAELRDGDRARALRERGRRASGERQRGRARQRMQQVAAANRHGRWRGVDGNGIARRIGEGRAAA
jgi:hypothetical protein